MINLFLVLLMHRLNKLECFQVESIQSNLLHTKFELAALMTDISRGWKCLPMKNTLAYSDSRSMTIMFIIVVSAQADETWADILNDLFSFVHFIASIKWTKLNKTQNIDLHKFHFWLLILFFCNICKWNR